MIKCPECKMMVEDDEMEGNRCYICKEDEGVTDDRNAIINFLRERGQYRD